MEIENHIPVGSTVTVAFPLGTANGTILAYDSLGVTVLSGGRTDFLPWTSVVRVRLVSLPGKPEVWEAS